VQSQPPQASVRQLPPRTLPILYFATAHVALTLAFAAVALDPRGIAGFFYHARMVAIVHLVTLGWITSSILGAIYIVGPVALRMHLPATRRDYTAFAFVLVGIVGMISHFWIAEFGGMAWSAATVAIGIMMVGVRVGGGLRRAKVPAAISTHVALAFTNITIAAIAGVLIGFDKVYHFLPGFVLSNVFAHAHLAAIGWASMMVVGIGYRLLPMVLPAQMPEGPRLWLSAVLIEMGILGLFVTLVLGAAYVWFFALIVVSGLLVFVSQAVWMVRHPRPRPPALPRVDPAVVHAAAALLSLAIASALGVWLAVAQTSPATLRVAMAYGVFGLVGFLGQMVIGMEGRLLPMFAWYWAFANTGFKGPVAAPHEMPWRAAQDVVVVAWVFGVPALAIGLALDLVPIVSGAAWCLLAATILDTANVAVILRFAYGKTA
jgi:hypothetical protein